MGAPVARAGVETLGCHDEQSGVFVRHRRSSSLRPVISRENAYRAACHRLTPLGVELFGQGSQRGEVDGPVTPAETVLNGEGGQPGFAAAGRHLQHAAKAAR